MWTMTCEAMNASTVAINTLGDSSGNCRAKSAYSVRNLGRHREHTALRGDHLGESLIEGTLLDVGPFSRSNIASEQQRPWLVFNRGGCNQMP
jgi:hypothetical protein